MPWTLVFVLTIYLPLLAINFYVGRKLLDAITVLKGWSRKRVRQVLVALLGFVNLLPVVFFAAYQLKGRVIVPEFAGDNLLVDLLLTYPFWIALVIAFQLFILYVVADITKFWILRFFRRQQEWWRMIEPRFVVGAFLVILVYSGFRIYADTWTVRIVEKEVHVPESFSALDGLRIVQVSDVQGDGRTTYETMRRFVRRVNSLQPDLILFAGDLVTSGTKYVDSSASILGELRSTYGTYAAVGDHDIFSSKSQVVASLVRNGIRVVEDSTVFLTVRSTPVALTVVTYTYSQRPTRDRLLQASRGTDGAYEIFLVHQPAAALIDFAGAKGYNLFLAGHTHGGGIAFGIPGLFLVAPATFESRFVSGFHKVGDMLVSVTNGLGFTLAPIRYHAPAEITMLKLKK